MSQSLKSHIELVDDPDEGVCYIALTTDTVARGVILMAVVRCRMDRRTLDGMRYERVIRKEEPELWRNIKQEISR